jgi:hypothetical protein
MDMIFQVPSQFPFRLSGWDFRNGGPEVFFLVGCNAMWYIGMNRRFGGAYSH